MKKGIKKLLLCMVVVFPMLFLSFVAKADNKDVEISVYEIPTNGTDEKHLMCGSSLVFQVGINSSDVDKDKAKIEWQVTKKDGTTMQAVYEVQDDGKKLEVYAPYGYAEELEVTACVNGKEALTDTYSFETQENEKMVGKTFFQFDMGSIGDVVCEPTKEVWDVEKQTYSIIMPYVKTENTCILFHGWKCSDGNIYDPGAKVTVPKKNGFMLVSAWYDELDEPEVMATKVPLFTEKPMVTTAVAITTATAATTTTTIATTTAAMPQSTGGPGDALGGSTEPAISIIPMATQETIVTIVPEITQVPALSEKPIASVSPEKTSVPVVTGTPEITNAPMLTNTQEVAKTPEVTNIPQATKKPVSEVENDNISTVSKITVKKVGSRKVEVSWSKVSKAKGCRIAYSTNKSFKNSSTKYKTTKETKGMLTKLIKNKTYYVKVCAYRVVNGKRIFGTYSKVKKIELH